MKYLLLALLGLTACGSKEGAGVGDTNPCYITNGTTTVYAYGDSITHGVQKSSIGKEDCFNNYVLEFINLNSYSLENHAIGGTDLTDNNQSITLLTQTWMPGSIVIFTPGVNDAAHHGNDQSYLYWYEQTMTQIVLNMASQNITAYIGTPIHVLSGINNSDINLYAQINRDVVTNLNNPNIKLVDFNSQYTPSQSTTADNVHPNSLGFDMMTQILTQSL